MFERLLSHAEKIGAQMAEQKRDEWVAATQPPPGVTVEAVDGGVILSGKRLRRRLIDNPQLRNFGR